MRVEVVRHGDFVVSEGRRDEPDSEGLARAAEARDGVEGLLRLEGGDWGREGRGLVVEGREEAVGDVSEGDEEREVARGLRVRMVRVTASKGIDGQ